MAVTPPEQFRLRFNVLVPISLYPDNSQHPRMISLLSFLLLVCCPAYIFSVSQHFAFISFHNPGYRFLFLTWTVLQKSSDILLPSISAYFTCTATRVIFLYLTYMSLLCLKLCEAAFLIELYLILLAWHLKAVFILPFMYSLLLDLPHAHGTHFSWGP